MSGSIGSLAAPIYPPSGITRNYGVDFFIYTLPTYPKQMAATNTPQSPAASWMFMVSPSIGLQQYFDYILGPAPLVQASYDDCITDAFMGDAGSNGGPGMQVG